MKKRPIAAIRPGDFTPDEGLNATLDGRVSSIKESLLEVIRKKGNKWYVYSETGKKLGGPYPTEAAAKKRLAQIEYFKHRGG